MKILYRDINLCIANLSMKSGKDCQRLKISEIETEQGKETLTNVAKLRITNLILDASLDRVLVPRRRLEK